MKLCRQVDAESFVVLNEEYTKDKNKVYYKWISPGRFWVVEMPEADAKTFESLDFNLARDQNHVWRMDEIVPGAHAASAEVIHPHRLWKDQNRVYYQSNVIPNADPRTIQHLGYTYYRDNEDVFWCSSTIADADTETFEVLGNSFVAKDANRVYRSGKPLPEIDPATCRLLLHNDYGYQVLSDKNGVYLNRLKFLHADPSTFTMIDDLTGKGGKYVFLVDRWHSTPVTVFKDDGALVVETVMYEKETGKPLAIVTAEVSGNSLKNLRFSPAPGSSRASTVPDWQLEILQRPDLVKRMKAAAKHLE